MLSGEDVYTLPSGNKCKVTWTAPEVGVDITQEEYDKRLQNCARVCLEIAQATGLNFSK